MNKECLLFCRHSRFVHGNPQQLHGLTQGDSCALHLFCPILTFATAGGPLGGFFFPVPPTPGGVLTKIYYVAMNQLKHRLKYVFVFMCLILSFNDQRHNLHWVLTAELPPVHQSKSRGVSIRVPPQEEENWWTGRKTDDSHSAAASSKHPCHLNSHMLSKGPTVNTLTHTAHMDTHTYVTSYIHIKAIGVSLQRVMKVNMSWQVGAFTVPKRLQRSGNQRNIQKQGPIQSMVSKVPSKVIQ